MTNSINYTITYVLFAAGREGNVTVGAASVRSARAPSTRPRRCRSRW
ncbi:MAG: hypothetical protein ACLRSE_07770 [Alistipes finegoldii]